MTRTLAFAGSIPARSRYATKAEPTPLALDLDPRSATAAQVALVLADIRSWSGCLWVTPAGEETTDASLIPDADLIEEVRASLWSAEDVTDYDDQPAELYAAWVALVTRP